MGLVILLALSSSTNGPNGDGGFDNKSGAELKCGTVQVRSVRFAG